MRIRVTAPNRRFNGRINEDTFYRGVCDDASERNLPYYIRQGYTIGDTDTVAESPEPDNQEVGPEEETVDGDEAPAAQDTADSEDAADDMPAPASPKRNAPRAVWAAFLADQGLTVADGTSRDELITAWEQSRA
ncbi:MAG: hypothetical protein L0K27_10815 [Corynebacterium nuruki]|nr:hypothetical protein [Corynebacterium nuruki]